MPAQDDKRENQQKKFLGLMESHKRDQKYDCLWNNKAKIELKTRQVNKSCTTKRRVTETTLKEWEDVFWVISEYKKDKPDIIDGKTILLFPEHLAEWRKKTLNGLKKGTEKQLGYNDIDHLKGPSDIIEKVRKQVHKNDPHIGLKFINMGITIKDSKHFNEVMEEYYKEKPND
jgi:hypothetical protein